MRENTSTVKWTDQGESKKYTVAPKPRTKPKRTVTMDSSWKPKMGSGCSGGIRLSNDGKNTERSCKMSTEVMMSSINTLQLIVLSKRNSHWSPSLAETNEIELSNRTGYHANRIIPGSWWFWYWFPCRHAEPLLDHGNNPRQMDTEYNQSKIQEKRWSYGPLKTLRN